MQLLRYLTRQSSREPPEHRCASCFDEDQEPVLAYRLRDLEQYLSENHSAPVRASVQIPTGLTNLYAGKVVPNVSLELEVEGRQVRFGDVQLTLIAATPLQESYLPLIDPSLLENDRVCDHGLVDRGQDDGVARESYLGDQHGPRSKKSHVYIDGTPDFNSLYGLQLCYLLSSERQNASKLPGMIESACDPQFKQTLQFNLQRTEVHMDRLKKIIDDLNCRQLFDEKERGFAALLAVGEAIIRELESGPLRDAALIATVQQINRYDIASYSEAIEWAKLLNFPRHVTVLKVTIDEKRADQSASPISEPSKGGAVAA